MSADRYSPRRRGIGHSERVRRPMLLIELGSQDDAVGCIDDVQSTRIGIAERMD